MALPQLNHKNVVRYFGSWIESIDQEEAQKVQKRYKQIQKGIQKKRASKQKVVALGGVNESEGEESDSLFSKASDYIEADEDDMSFIDNQEDSKIQIEDKLPKPEAKDLESSNESQTKVDVLTMCDDDALYEFAKKDERFISIDLMI